MGSPVLLSLKHIKLSTRTALLFGGGLLMILGLSILLTWFFFLREINALELKATTETNRQAHQAILLKLSDMARRSGDWAFWDETYKLVTEGDPDYHERNLNTDSLKINDLNVMIFLSRTGEVIDSAQLNTAKDHSEPVDPALINELLSEKVIGRQFQRLLHTEHPELKPLSGIVSLWGDPMLLSLTPVTSGNMDSKVGGWMIWLKRVHEFFPQRYSQILSGKATLLNTTPGILPEQVNNELQQQKATYASILTDNDISVFSVFPDINQQPAAFIKITAPRDYYHSSLEALSILAFSCVLGGILISLLFFRELRRNLGTRLHALEDGLKRLAQNDYSQPLSQDNVQDEISMVSQVVNKLLSTKLADNDALEEVENKFYAVYENASQPMLITHEKRVLSANQAAANMLGYDSMGDLIGRHMDNLLHVAGKQDSGSDLFYQRITAKEYKFEWDIVGHLGWLVPCELDITPIDHHGAQALLVCMNDISERRLHENKIRRLVFNDTLTGLLNRYALIQRMEPILKQLTDGHRFALLYINLDRFRAINDTFGHEIGDGVIKSVALRLGIECDTCSMSTLARIAGDEFVVFIPEIATPYQPVRLAHELQKLLLQPLIIDGVSLEISTTISVIIGGMEYTTVEDVLRCADFAMSKAKKQSKRIQIFSHRMYLEALETLAIQRDLPSAIRNGQITPVFQPIVSCSKGEIIGFEALARWQHDELGPISPARFIPMAEESNLIVELGEQMLIQACQFVQQLNHMRTVQGQSALSVHVNFSAHHFSSSSLLANLRNILDETSLNPQHLVIEITESMLIERPVESVRRMEQIKQLGVKLALDDFGTGYSALNTLCQYPLDIVKLDRSFILRLMDGKQGEVLVRAIINMAKDLELDMVAEGVETYEQLQKIKALGVSEIQGFYYYRPMPAANVFALFDTETVVNASS